MKHILVSIKVSLSQKQKDRLIEAAQGNEILFVDQSKVTEEQVRGALRSFSHSVSYLVTAKGKGGKSHA